MYKKQRFFFFSSVWNSMCRCWLYKLIHDKVKLKININRRAAREERKGKIIQR